MKKLAQRVKTAAALKESASLQRAAELNKEWKALHEVERFATMTEQVRDYFCAVLLTLLFATALRVARLLLTLRCAAAAAAAVRGGARPRPEPRRAHPGENALDRGREIGAASGAGW